MPSLESFPPSFEQTSDGVAVSRNECAAAFVTESTSTSASTV
jgi:hypothetical protein